MGDPSKFSTDFGPFKSSHSTAIFLHGEKLDLTFKAFLLELLPIFHLPCLSANNQKSFLFLLDCIPCFALCFCFPPAYLFVSLILDLAHIYPSPVVSHSLLIRERNLLMAWPHQLCSQGRHLLWKRQNSIRRYNNSNNKLCNNHNKTNNRNLTLKRCSSSSNSLYQSNSQRPS